MSSALRNVVWAALLTVPSLASQPALHDVAISAATESPAAVAIPAHLHWLAVDASGRPGAKPPQEMQIELPWQGTLSLQAEESLQVWVSADGWWSPRATISSLDSEVALKLLATGELAGRLQVPDGERPRRAEVVLQPSGLDARPGPDSDSPVTTECCIVGSSSFQCEVPRGTWHAKVEIDEFVPLYFWEIEVEAGSKTRLAERKLETGASLAGRVEVPDGEVVSAEVTLKPEVYGLHRQSSSRNKLGHQARKQEVDERGFFQFSGIPPGGFSVTVTQNGLAPQHLGGIVIEKAEELVLEDSIVMTRPATLRVSLQPPVDWFGEPWELVLRQVDWQRGYQKSVGRSRADVAGDWFLPQLIEGLYWLEVVDSQGSSWHSQEVEVLSGDSPYLIELEAVEVRGWVGLGDEPLTTTLVFGTPYQRPRVTFESSEDGEFAGYLPREGSWPVTLLGDDEVSNFNVAPVEVVQRSGKSYAEVEIELPDTRVLGRVEEDGEPVAGALITVFRQDRKRQYESDLKASDDGTFEVRGLQPTGIALAARFGTKRSEWAYAEVHEGDPGPEIVLELKERRTLSGRVVHSGRGIPGAEILAVPVSSDFLPASQKVSTGAEGEFALELPEHIQAVDVLVGASGYAVLLQRFSVEHELLLPLTMVSGGLASAFTGGKEEQSLSRGGATLPFDVFWGQMRRWNRTSIRDLGGFFVQGMTPGLYRLCSTTLRDQRCDSGELLAHSELFLSTSMSGNDPQDTVDGR